MKKLVFQAPPCLLKFNVDGDARGKPELAGVGQILCNSNVVVFIMLWKHMGYMDSNEGEVVAILEAIQIYNSSSLQSKLVLESDSLNAMSWLTSVDKTPQRFQFCFKEIRALSLSIQVEFQHAR